MSNPSTHLKDSVATYLLRIVFALYFVITLGHLNTSDFGILSCQRFYSLRMVQKIMQLHQGEVQVVSTPEEKTRFTLQLKAQD